MTDEASRSPDAARRRSPRRSGWRSCATACPSRTPTAARTTSARSTSATCSRSPGRRPSAACSAPRSTASTVARSRVNIPRFISYLRDGDVRSALPGRGQHPALHLVPARRRRPLRGRVAPRRQRPAVRDRAGLPAGDAVRAGLPARQDRQAGRHRLPRALRRRLGAAPHRPARPCRGRRRPASASRSSGPVRPG